MATEVEVKEWGNSLAVILPREFVNDKQIKAKDKILIEAIKQANLKHIFGTLPRKKSGQKFKDMVREGW